MQGHRPDGLNKAKTAWHEELQSLGLKPAMVPLVEDSDEKDEADWIRRLTLAGCELLNRTGSIDKFKHIREAALAFSDSKAGLQARASMNKRFADKEGFNK